MSNDYPRIHDPERKIPCVRDPHHNGSMEWALINGRFYSRLAGHHSAWNRCQRFHATPARVLALASLVNNSTND